MFKKLVKKIKKLNEQNQYHPHNHPVKQEQDNVDTDSAQYQMINSLTNYKLIIPHLKDQEQQQIKFLKLIKILAAEQIDLLELKHLFYNYISYQYYTLRSLIWRVVMDYIPVRNNKWITKMEASKVNYEKLILDNLISSIKKLPKQSQSKQKVYYESTSTQIKTQIDHPLSKNVNSTWNNYFKDHQRWTKIQKDMLRTRPKVKFFQQQHELQLQTIEFQQPLNLTKNKRSSFHYDAVTRILFIYCKLHPQIGYSQGMNQIAALIYYVFTNKNSQYQRRVSQSDAYNCFCIIMQKLGPNHFTSKQQLNQRIRIFCQGLRKVDQKLYKVFQQNKIDLQLCCMRWMMIFMLQQFEINQAILIWDGLLCSDVGINKYVNYYCLAVMFIKRDQLIQNPSSVYGEVKIKPNQLLETAMHLFKQYPTLFG